MFHLEDDEPNKNGVVYTYLVDSHGNRMNDGNPVAAKLLRKPFWER